ncbi:hypothetical protein ACFJIS_00260 [Variovorax boronicumulans]|uniref:hypothetical protein n=1 Tax=Variovorax boronicumulans TaxID=436515 RepID=UPI0036F31395
MVASTVATQGFTVNVAAWLVTLPLPPVTCTRSCWPLSASWPAAVVKLSPVAPATSLQLAPPSTLRCHW